MIALIDEKYLVHIAASLFIEWPCVEVTGCGAGEGDRASDCASEHATVRIQHQPCLPSAYGIYRLDAQPSCDRVYSKAVACRVDVPHSGEGQEALSHIEY